MHNCDGHRMTRERSDHRAICTMMHETSIAITEGNMQDAIRHSDDHIAFHSDRISADAGDINAEMPVDNLVVASNADLAALWLIAKRTVREDSKHRIKRTKSLTAVATTYCDAIQPHKIESRLCDLRFEHSGNESEPRYTLVLKQPGTACILSSDPAFAVIACRITDHDPKVSFTKSEDRDHTLLPDHSLANVLTVKL